MKMFTRQIPWVSQTSSPPTLWSSKIFARKILHLDISPLTSNSVKLWHTKLTWCTCLFIKKSYSLMTAIMQWLAIWLPRRQPEMIVNFWANIELKPKINSKVCHSFLFRSHEVCKRDRPNLTVVLALQITPEKVMLLKPHMVFVVSSWTVPWISLKMNSILSYPRVKMKDYISPLS